MKDILNPDLGIQEADNLDERLPESFIDVMVRIIELPYAVVSAVLLDETLEDLPRDELGNIGKNRPLFIISGDSPHNYEQILK